jgi:hypothetical protein
LFAREIEPDVIRIAAGAITGCVLAVLVGYPWLESSRLHGGFHQRAIIDRLTAYRLSAFRNMA